MQMLFGTTQWDHVERHSPIFREYVLFAFWMLNLAFSDARSGDDAKGVQSKRHSADCLKQALFAFWMLNFAFSDARSGDDAKRGEVEASFSQWSQAGAVCILDVEFCIQ